MEFKKLVSLIAFTPLLLGSCSYTGSHYVVKNMNSYFSESLYKEFTIESFEKERQVNHEFLVLFISEGCSACEAFKPEFNAFQSENHYTVLKFEAKDHDEEVQQIINDYGELFAKDGTLYFPSLFIVHASEVEELPYSKLKNKTMIYNTFRSCTHECNVYYAEGNILEAMLTHSTSLPFYDEFAYISFNFSDGLLLKYFNASLSTYINELSCPVIVTDYNEENEYIVVKKKHITSEGHDGTKGETRSKDSSNLENVKEILNK